MSMFREMKLSPKKRERTKVKHARRGKGRKVEPPPVPKSEKVADKAGLIWFYGLNDKRHGPVSQKDLLRLVEAKTLSGESLVWKKGMKDWVELNTVKELAK